MTLGATFDTFEAIIGDGGDAAVLDVDRTEPVVVAPAVDDAATGDTRPEPRLTATPLFIEFDEPAQLDPERAGLVWELPPMASRPIRLGSPLASLLFHLLPLLALIIWPLVMIEPPSPIPVQLVFEPPPPPPAPPPPQPKPMPKPPQFENALHGPLSSVDQGLVKPQLDLGRTPDPVPQPTFGQPQPSANETQTAAVPPVPPPKPAPPKEQPSFRLSKPAGAPSAPKTEARHEAPPHIARYAGPAATRDEYLAYLVALTRQHIDLLPLSVVAGRRGETVISVTVYDSGRIGPLGVLRSSGYPDIDRRIEEMVAAVGKFPPLPQWYQGNAVQLELTLKFPEALEER